MKTVEQLAAETVFRTSTVKEVFEMTKDIELTEKILRQSTALQIHPIEMLLNYGFRRNLN